MYHGIPIYSFSTFRENKLSDTKLLVSLSFKKLHDMKNFSIDSQIAAKEVKLTGY